MSRLMYGPLKTAEKTTPKCPPDDPQEQLVYSSTSQKFAVYNYMTYNVFLCAGSGGGTRTPDLRIMIPAFYIVFIYVFSSMSHICRVPPSSSLSASAISLPSSPCGNKWPYTSDVMTIEE